MKYDKTGLMKKFIIANKIFIAVQLCFVVFSIVCNFIFSDTAVFVTVFIHVGIFVIFNAVSESIVEYGYLRKKYARICDEIHPARYFKLKNECIKLLKTNKTQ